MPPPTSHSAFHVKLLSEEFRVQQQSPHDPLPEKIYAQLTGRDGATTSKFISVTGTDDETSIVSAVTDGEEGEWRCLKIAGPMDFGITGVMANFTVPLKEARVPIFAVSTWNTDYILVPKDKAEAAVAVLKSDGWTFAE
ncbi:ACT domain-containing protein [Gloeopeniophorella convolvens]|nr:ACT domain-containing protein [Gloeopeniophorella convolvens]